MNNQKRNDQTMSSWELCENFIRMSYPFNVTLCHFSFSGYSLYKPRGLQHRGSSSRAIIRKGLPILIFTDHRRIFAVSVIDFLSICLGSNNYKQKQGKNTKKVATANIYERYLLSSSYQERDPTALFCMTKDEKIVNPSCTL